MRAEKNNAQDQQLSELEKDILATASMKKQNTIDQAEEDLSYVRGALEFAVENGSNKEFYAGLVNMLKKVDSALAKLRE